MSDQTLRLELPYILPSQALKHVTHNEALRLIDGLVHLAISDRTLTAPPAMLADGDRFIVATGASGAWAGEDGKLAAWQEGAWSFATPRTGWLAWAVPEARLLVFDGAAWVPAALTSVDPIALVGVNATADLGHRLTVKSDGVLFSHDDVTPGTGDILLTLNKGAAGRDAALVFEDGWVAGALAGLLGDDDFTVKVTADGTTYRTGFTIERSSGAARFPSGVAHAETGRALCHLLPCAQAAEIWRSDAARPASPRTYAIAAVSGTAIDLTTPDVGQIFTSGMQNAAMVRIWNVSKSPAEAAWVNWNNSATQLNVSNAADIASWGAGDTLQLGDPDPTGANVSGMIAIDIGNFMYNTLGAVFRQAGVLLSVSASGVGGDATLEGSGSGAAGSALATASDTDGKAAHGTQILFTTEASPVSNSNLVFLGESLGSATGLASCRLRLQGLYV